ncbi:MAG: D-alanyl-D-alanine carboxypeptidase [Butyrivibrio sp.]|nr:D-alanyl-D-alanine carboxypeptidase [Butyrivibrio sp.]
MNKKILLIITFLLSSAMLCACADGTSILNTYSEDIPLETGGVADSPLSCADGFASKIAVVPADAVNSQGSDRLHSEAALLVDVSDGTVLFQKNAHKKEYPASTTKILTSMLALKYGDSAASRTIGDEVIITEDNVVLCDFRIGDVIPFDILINASLLRSGNDAAAALALFAAPTLEDFADLMNEEAQKIGATESHFVNPHGLYDDNHYTTAYDMYLIFNEAIKYDKFVKVLSTVNYQNSFVRKTIYGEYTINCEYASGNQYLQGTSAAPSHIKVIGGKAGYTELARRSYVMLAEANGHRYIFVTMRADSNDEIYEDLDYLMQHIPDDNLEH